MAKVQRLLGVFLLLMAFLVLIDWIIALYFHIPPRVFAGITFMLCPGNGFAAFCTPLWFLLRGLFVAAVGIVLIINLPRRLRMNRDGPVMPTTRKYPEIEMALYAALAIIVGHLWLALSYFLPARLEVGAHILAALFLVVSSFTSFRLLRDGASN